MLFEGSGVALVTPFKKNGEINFERLGQLIEFHIENNTDALIVCGTTGESATMTHEEKFSVFDYTVKKANGRIPVIAGTGTNNTKDAVEMSMMAEVIGVDGLLVVTPYYNKATQEGLITHYAEIASSVRLPIIVYNVPSRTGVNVKPDTISELSKIPNIVGVKEASGDISQILEIASKVPENFYIYSGNDDQIVPIMSLGGKGVISVLANVFPKETHDMCEAYKMGDVNRARELQIKYSNFIKLLFSEVNPIPVKAAMKELGMDCGIPRLPLTPMNKVKKRSLINEYNKLKNDK